MINKLVSAVLTVFVSFGMVGMVATTGVLAAEDACNAQNSANTNHECYWEKQLSAQCTKYDNINAKSFTVPAAPAGQTYIEAIVKAGSGDEAHERKGAVVAGQVLTRSDGKDISHVILCYKPAGGSGTTGGGTPVTGGSGTTGGGTPVTGGGAQPSRTPSQPTGGAGAAEVTSLPVTTGSSEQLATAIILVSSILVSAGAYAARTRTGFSL